MTEEEYQKFYKAVSKVRVEQAQGRGRGRGGGVQRHGQEQGVDEGGPMGVGSVDVRKAAWGKQCTECGCRARLMRLIGVAAAAGKPLQPLALG